MLSRTEHSEEDKERDCVHYPTKEYQTYADCDQDYVRRTLPSDLVPFWNVDNISQATSFWTSEHKETSERALAVSGLTNIQQFSTKMRTSLILEQIVFGQKISNCKVHYVFSAFSHFSNLQNNYRFHV